jgi:hypothetical protein
MTRGLLSTFKRESRVLDPCELHLSLTLERETAYSAALVGAEEPCKPLSFG